MGFRRFQNFSIGALTASRLNELQAAVERLQAKVEGKQPTPNGVRETILARITGQGKRAGEAESCGESSIRTVSYPFQEIFLRINPVGDISAGTCVDSESAEGGIGSATGGYLVRFEDEPTLSAGTVVMAHLAPYAVTGNAEDKQVVYVALGGLAGGALRLGRVTQSLGGGMYKARFLGAGTQQEVEFSNIYEVEDYYGATTASIECAAITPKTIPLDRVVWLQQVMGDTGPNAVYPDNSWVTLVPVAFDAECTCGPGGIAAQQQYGAGVEVRDANAAIANIMLDKGLTLT